MRLEGVSKIEDVDAGRTPSLLSPLLGRGSLGKNFYQHFQSSRSGAGREALPSLPVFSPLPDGQPIELAST